jgi:hypothetical protein
MEVIEINAFCLSIDTFKLLKGIFVINISQTTSFRTYQHAMVCLALEVSCGFPLGLLQVKKKHSSGNYTSE